MRIEIYLLISYYVQKCCGFEDADFLLDYFHYKEALGVVGYSCDDSKSN